MRKLWIVLLVLAAGTAQGQKIPNPKPFAKTITEQDLKDHLYIVAGKEMQGRRTATEGQRKAAAYIENYFKSIGLAPGFKGSYQMPYPVYEEQLGTIAVAVNGVAFAPYQDFAVSARGGYSATLLSSEVVFVGQGRKDSATNDFGSQAIAGKVVMIDGSASPGGRRPAYFTAINEAREKGAAAILLIQDNFPRTQSVAGSMQSTNVFNATISPNVFYISGKVATAIMGKPYQAVTGDGAFTPEVYKADVKLEVEKKVTTLEASNVLGYLEGTDLKDELLVISAHYDHLGMRDTTIYYGADDDGSGTVSIMELAQAFAKAKADGKGPRRSILFLANSGEEEGLWGSHYYSEHPAYPLDKTTADLNIDMIGRIDPNRKEGDSTNYVYVVGDDKLSSDLRPISEAMNKKYLKMELDYKFNDPNDRQRIYYRSDHYNFARKGVPIIFYFDGIHKDYHKPTDTPDKINYDIMAKRAQLVFYTAWEMANRNDMLKRDIPLP